MIIKEVKAKAIKDSRGENTIEVSVNGAKPASAPTGKSTGKHENRPYFNSLEWNINFLNGWREEVEIRSFDDLEIIEDLIKKGIREKRVKRFGANALFAFESAILKALAEEEEKELWEVINPRLNTKRARLPFPVGNTVGGGVHSSKFRNHPDFQEFLVIPLAKSFSENVDVMKYFYETIGKELKAKQKNDEGAWQTSEKEQEVIDLMNSVKRMAEKKFKIKIGIGLDVAASSFFKNEDYVYKSRGKLNRNKQIRYITDLILENDLVYVEDPVQENDFAGFGKIKFNLGKESGCLIVGDDLTATHINRIERAVEGNAINALIVKPNQNGSLVEVAKIFRICRKNGLKTVVSHRSGETMDNALADYAFAFQADFIKTGISGKWRDVKLKRLMEIEKSLGRRK